MAKYRNHGNEQQRFRAVQRFSMGRGRRCVPGDILEFPYDDGQAQRLVDIGRIVPALDDQAEPAAPAAAKAAGVEVNDELQALVEETMGAAWHSIVPALKQHPVEALELALELEQNGKRRQRLMSQLDTEISARKG